MQFSLPLSPCAPSSILRSPAVFNPGLARSFNNLSSPPPSHVPQVLGSAKPVLRPRLYIAAVFQIHNSLVCVSRVSSNRNPLAGEVALFHCIRTTQNKAPFFHNFCSSRPSSTFESSVPPLLEVHPVIVYLFPLS